MKILGIDTSCDDTAISLMEITNFKSQIPNFRILSNIVSSQVKLHARYGGVYPFLAKREHQKNLPFVFKRATKRINLSDIDLIGVTIGPGLEPCLWQGVNFAKKLAKKINKPLVPVNHIEAHILANVINNQQLTINDFPAICLVVSGGHTQLILMREIGKYKILGETRDDAAGECFDKTARILGLGYPGGPAIASEAAKFKIQNSKFKIVLPRPMIYTKDYDFSFSGLKTAVLYHFRSQPQKVRKSKEYIKIMAYEIQQAIIDVLLHKTIKAARDFKVKSIILGGGVAANQELRKQFKVASSKWKFKYFVPEKNLCTDNAAMIAATTYFHQRKATRDLKKIKANANLRI